MAEALDSSCVLCDKKRKDGYSAKAVANEVKNNEKIDEPEIPNSLKDDVLVNCRSQWTKRWQRRTLARVREENRLKTEHVKKLGLQ